MVSENNAGLNTNPMAGTREDWIRRYGELLDALAEVRSLLDGYPVDPLDKAVLAVVNRHLPPSHVVALESYRPMTESSDPLSTEATMVLDALHEPVVQQVIAWAAEINTADVASVVQELLHRLECS